MGHSLPAGAGKPPIARNWNASYAAVEKVKSVAPCNAVPRAVARCVEIETTVVEQTQVIGTIAVPISDNRQCRAADGTDTKGVVRVTPGNAIPLAVTSGIQLKATVMVETQVVRAVVRVVFPMCRLDPRCAVKQTTLVRRQMRR